MMPNKENPIPSLSGLALIAALSGACNEPVDTAFDTGDTAIQEVISCPDGPRQIFATWSLNGLDQDEVEEELGHTDLIFSTDETWLGPSLEGMSANGIISIESKRGEFAPDEKFDREKYIEIVERFAADPNLAEYVSSGKLKGWMLFDDIGNYQAGYGPTKEDVYAIIEVIDSIFPTDLASDGWMYILRDDLHDSSGNDLASHGIEGPFDDSRIVVYTQYRASKNPDPVSWTDDQIAASTDYPGTPAVFGLNLDHTRLSDTDYSSCEDLGSIPSHTDGFCLATIDDIESVTTAFDAACPENEARGVWGLVGYTPEYLAISEYVLENPDYMRALREFGHRE